MVASYTGAITSAHEAAIADATDGNTFEAWIDGQSIAGAGDSFETRDPAVDEPITTVPRFDEAAVDAAVEAGQDVVDGTWGDLTVAERSDAILEWVDLLCDHADELALLESLDCGKPLDAAHGEVSDALDFIAYYAHVVRGETDRRVPVDGDTHAYTRTEPYGVAGLILPWNYPLLLASWKLGPALAAGNAVVVKPSAAAPLSITRVAELSAGVLPDGVVNVVHGSGSVVGDAIARHDSVNKLSFTGNALTGERVMEAAAEGITPVTLELGGKSPLLVFPDADLEAAAATAADGVFYNAGQSCDAFSRTLVHESIHDEFLELFVAEAESLSVGDPLTEETAMGPLASRDQFETVRDYVGHDTDATLAYGGESVNRDELGAGWFHEPTIFTDVDNDSRLAQEEIFGPVASVVTFADYDEAIEIANDVDYGLASGVATSDLSLAHRAAADIEAGSVWVNEYPGIAPGLPFGGYKRSGIGRECEKSTLDAYRQRKTVTVALEDPTL